MLVVLVALVSAMGFAVSQICIRVGLSYGPPSTAISFSIVSATPIVWMVLGPWVSWDQLLPPGVAWFMMAGSVAPLGTQLLLFVATPHVGIARASPLRNTSPLFASLLAIAFLGERWTVPIAAGTLSILLGASLLGMGEGKLGGRYPRRYLLLALSSGILGGFAAPMQKFGFGIMSDVALAACSLMTGSFLTLLLYLLLSGQFQHLVITAATVRWFGLAGLASAVGVTANLAAISMGDVVIVSPLTSTVPLFTMVLAAVFLRKLEKVTRRIVLGTSAICAGAIVLSTV